MSCVANEGKIHAKSSLLCRCQAKLKSHKNGLFGSLFVSFVSVLLLLLSRTDFLHFFSSFFFAFFYFFCIVSRKIWHKDIERLCHKHNSLRHAHNNDRKDMSIMETICCLRYEGNTYIGIWWNRLAWWWLLSLVCSLCISLSGSEHSVFGIFKFGTTWQNVDKKFRKKNNKLQIAFLCVTKMLVKFNC